MGIEQKKSTKSFFDYLKEHVEEVNRAKKKWIDLKGLVRAMLGLPLGQILKKRDY